MISSTVCQRSVFFRCRIPGLPHGIEAFLFMQATDSSRPKQDKVEVFFRPRTVAEPTGAENGKVGGGALD